VIVTGDTLKNTNINADPAVNVRSADQLNVQNDVHSANIRNTSSDVSSNVDANHVNQLNVHVNVHTAKS